MLHEIRSVEATTTGRKVMLTTVQTAIIKPTLSPHFRNELVPVNL